MYNQSYLFINSMPLSFVTEYQYILNREAMVLRLCWVAIK